MKTKFISGMAVCVLLATGAVFGQNDDEKKSDDLKSLKEAYAGQFLIGTAQDFPRGFSEAELANAKFHYDIVTPENCMKPQPTHPSEDTYNFSAPDALVEWADENGLEVWGHTLLWHSQTGRWFFEDATAAEDQTAAAPERPEGAPAERPEGARNRRPGGGFGGGNAGPQASKEVILERLKEHIFTVAGRYKGKIMGWDVANESIADDGDWTTENLRNSSWYSAVGPEVLTLAFKWAHEADPDAELYYNDYNIEQGASKDTGKHAASLILLKRLIKEGAPIDGVGIQGHWHLDTNLEDVEKAIENYGKLGLKVSITELDVTSTGDNSGAFGVRRGENSIPPENYEKQAEVYKKLFEIFNRHSDVIDRVTFWGISDTRSWRRGQDALLFTGDLEPKPAFHAVIDAAPSK